MCSYSLYFSLLSLSKERIGVVVLVSFFISRSLGDYAILLPPKRAGTPTYMKGWTYGRFSKKQNFLNA